MNTFQIQSKAHRVGRSAQRRYISSISEIFVCSLKAGYPNCLQDCFHYHHCTWEKDAQRQSGRTGTCLLRQFLLSALFLHFAEVALSCLHLFRRLLFPTYPVLSGLHRPTSCKKTTGRCLVELAAVSLIVAFVVTLIKCSHCCPTLGFAEM